MARSSIPRLPQPPTPVSGPGPGTGAPPAVGPQPFDRRVIWAGGVVFAVLNGIGLLIQDATVAFNYYGLGLGHDKLAGFIALNAGIVLATLFRFWSYRRFVWITPPTGEAGDTRGRPQPADRLPPNPGHAAQGRQRLSSGPCG